MLGYVAKIKENSQKPAEKGIIILISGGCKGYFMVKTLWIKTTEQVGIQLNSKWDVLLSKVEQKTETHKNSNVMYHAQKSALLEHLRRQIIWDLIQTLAWKGLWYKKYVRDMKVYESPCMFLCLQFLYSFSLIQKARYLKYYLGHLDEDKHFKYIHREGNKDLSEGDEARRWRSLRSDWMIWYQKKNRLKSKCGIYR